MAKKPTTGVNTKSATPRAKVARKKPAAAKAKTASKPTNAKAKTASKSANANAKKRAAAAAAAAAYEAQSQEPASSSGENEGGRRSRPRLGENENYLDLLSRVFDDMSGSQWNSDDFDDVTQGVTMVLGTGPAFAALESMMAFTSSQSAVMMNAVQTQRKLDQVGLCCTSACVKQLLNMNNNQDTD